MSEGVRSLGAKRFTPLRYPGGKSKLASFVKEVLQANSLEDGHYAEPFAGGAGIAIELLVQGYVSRISLNDISTPIFAFWRSVLDEPRRFADWILDVPLDLAEWDRQKGIFSKADQSGLFELGFATFYLNRTNRSGVLNGGLIGGRAQEGKWLMDARFNRDDLAARVQRIGRFRDQIELTRKDALEFLKDGNKSWGKDTLIYADPPYFVKGRQLYYDFYAKDDHAKLAALFCGPLKQRRWMISYDDVSEVRELYGAEASQAYFIPYSVRKVGMGNEVMFYSPSLILPIDAASGRASAPAQRFSPMQGSI